MNRYKRRPNPVQETINSLDSRSSNYGYAYDGEGYALEGDNLPAMQRGGPNRAKPEAGYSVNPAIANQVKGTSTFNVSVTCVKTGTGSGNTYNPIFLFGGDAFSNSSKGYTSVQLASPAQVTALAFTNNKNVITFKYATDGSNYSTYTVTLATEGEYPFILNSLSGKNKMEVVGTQFTISDSTQTTQLTQGFQTFFLDEFGKSTSNDLTVPKDLYQQATDGLWIPLPYKISGRDGLRFNMLEVNNFSVNLFMYVRKLTEGGCGCK